ncbi:MAG TPA: hypothetical protein PLB92_05885 [Rhodoglobus sp.]|nr:hypothetical protein [Rhodoglobus sp.]
MSFCNVSTIPLECVEEGNMPDDGSSTLEWARGYNCTATFAHRDINGHKMFTFDGEEADVRELLLDYFDGDEDEACGAMIWAD